jgi:uroporphyrinogen decarboxylase
MNTFTSRERIQRILSFEEPDRIGKTDSFWEDTLTRWQKEGLPAGDAADLFDFDIDYIYLDASLRLPERLLEDGPDYTIREDKIGYTAKQWKGRAGALDYLHHAVNTPEEWRALRERLEVDFGGTSRIADFSYFTPFKRYPTWQEMAERFLQIRRKERFILLNVYGPFEATWRKHGFVASLEDTAQNPGFLIEMAEAHTDLVLRTLEKAAGYGIVPDGLFLIEDMGMNTGLLFSPRTYEQILFPSHRRLGDYLRAHNIHYFMHSDGDIRRLIPRIIASGVQVLQPLEARCGLDLPVLKREYGRELAFMGNISVEAMAAGGAALEEEVRRKVTAGKQCGGYIYHSDHSVPSNVPYAHYVELMRWIEIYGSYA